MCVGGGGGGGGGAKTALPFSLCLSVHPYQCLPITTSA